MVQLFIKHFCTSNIPFYNLNLKHYKRVPIKSSLVRFKGTFIKGQTFRVKSLVNKRNFSTSLKKCSAFIDWPHINQIINNIKRRENNGEVLWECDYSFLTSAILPYYFHRTAHTTWVITPEFNYLEGNHPDYTIFLIPTGNWRYTAVIHAVVEIKSKTGDSWSKMLEQMWNQADVAKDDDGRLWAIGQKGLEICIFKFDVLKYMNQEPDCYTNFEPLNLSNLNTVQLDQLGVKYEECNDDGFARISLIKWRLDDPRHRPYIDRMFNYIRVNNA